MGNPCVYVWVESVPATPPDPSALWDILPKNQANEAYVAELCRDSQPAYVVSQRLTAMHCFAHILKATAPHLCPHLTLGRHEHGKPYVKCEGAEAPTISWSLSHTKDLAVCAVSLDMVSVGVDVEDMVPTDRAEKLKNRFFTPQEREMLKGLSCDDMAMASGVTRLWTMKEALFKCGGYVALLDVDVSRAQGMYFHTARLAHALLTVCTPCPGVRFEVLSTVSPMFEIETGKQSP